jgi:hypothetical protein
MMRARFISLKVRCSGGLCVYENEKREIFCESPRRLASQQPPSWSPLGSWLIFKGLG